MIILAILIGSIAMALLRPVAILGPIIAGVIAGLIAGGVTKGCVAGFLSGALGSIFAGFILTGLGSFFGDCVSRLEEAAASGTVGEVIGAGIFVCVLYFGLLGTAGGIFGGLVRQKTLHLQ